MSSIDLMIFKLKKRQLKMSVYSSYLRNVKGEERSIQQDIFLNIDKVTDSKKENSEKDDRKKKTR